VPKIVLIRARSPEKQTHLVLRQSPGGVSVSPVDDISIANIVLCMAYKGEVG